MSDFMTPFGTSGYTLFWGLFAVSFTLFLYRAATLARIYRLGRKDTAAPGKPSAVVRQVLLQLCSLKTMKRGDYAGLGHALLFWGFGFFLIGYFWNIGLGAGFGLDNYFESSTLWKVYAYILDITGILVFLAVIWAAARRFIKRPARLKPSPSAGIVLALVFCLMVLHFLSGGFGCAGGYFSGACPPVQNMFVQMFAGLPESSLQAGYLVTWWLHYALILGFLAYIPFSKHLHILASPLNIISRGGGKKGALTAPDLQSVSGTESISNIVRRQVLDLYSCAECGRCHEVCPAVISGKTLSPRELTLHMKSQIIKTGSAMLKNKECSLPLDPDNVNDDAIWECVTCRACEDVCPVDIRHIERVADLRRDGVLMKGQFPAKLRQFYRNIEENYNPWGKAWTYRGNWAEGSLTRGAKEGNPADTVYWPGCLGAYDERVQRVSTAVVRLLNAAGIPFTILGKHEKCCGDAVRRTGNEFLFREIARENIAVFNHSGIKKIITNCPHCYHVFKEEYPQFGGQYEVIHHTQLLAGLLQKGKIKIPFKQIQKTVVYHDPCYLGRYHGVFNEPRQGLGNIPSLNIIEKNPTAKDALCCGAGGGGMWMAETGPERISQVLLEQALEKRPDILATACPYCLTMLENESREKDTGNTTAVMDIIELYQNSIS